MRSLRHRILWITFWMTLAYWLGGAVGCANKGEDQNYKILEEDRYLFDTEKPSRAHPLLETLFAAGMAADDETVEPAPAPAVMESETTPSLVGIDRSGWDKVAVAPVSGRTGHGPVYFHDCPVWHREPVDPVLDNPHADLPVSAYLEGHKPACWDGRNTLGAFLQPTKFAFDLGVLPVKMILQPPFFTTHTTPEE